MAATANLVDLLSTSPPPFIYVQSPLGSLPLPSSHLETAFLNHPSVAIILLDSTECFSARSLFTTMVNALARWECSWNLVRGAGGECWEGSQAERWDATWDHFAAALQDAYRERANQDEGKSQINGKRNASTAKGTQAVFVFDHAEKLKANLPALIIPLVRMRELTRLPITTVFLSSLSWEDMSPSGSSSPDPFTIQIEHTSKADFISHMVSTFPPGDNDSNSLTAIHPYNPVLKPLYGQFLDALFKSCSNYTNEPTEMSYIASAMWPGFVRPLLEDWTAEKEAWEPAETGAEYHPNMTTFPNDGAEILVARFLRIFPQAFNNLYSRSISARSFIRAQQSQPCFRLSQPFVQVKPSDLSSTKSPLANNSSQTLPLLSKMLLVASYIASFNPSKTDLRMFGRTPDGVARKKKSSGRRRTKAGTVAKIPQRLAGPSPFSLERFMAIYAALLTEHGPDGDGVPLVEGEVEVEVNRSQVLMTISELTQRRLIQKTSQGEKLDNSIVFKCNISADTAERLAKDLKINLNELLWDPPE